MPTDFTPYQSMAGGMLIGLAATLLMLFTGRIAGITGILAGLLPPYGGRPNLADLGWRLAFAVGLIGSPLLYVAIFRGPVAIHVAGSPLLLLLSGAIVGVGVTYGSGCTSGHGICGLARFSPRSLAATVTFMASTVVTVFVARHLIGS